jgi:hypothetical protein
MSGNVVPNEPAEPADIFVTHAMTEAGAKCLRSLIDRACTEYVVGIIYHEMERARRADRRTSSRDGGDPKRMPEAPARS